MDHRIAMGVLASLFVGIVAMPSVAHAATPEEAKAFSERAAAYIMQVGEAKAFADFTRPRRRLRRRANSMCSAMTATASTRRTARNPLFVGKNLLHIKDPDGKEANFEIVKTGFEQGQGWVDFKWPNPMTKKIQQKSAYVIRTNDVVCGVGYYK